MVALEEGQALRKEETDIDVIDGRISNETEARRQLTKIAVDVIRENNGQGEYAERAVKHLVDAFYDDAWRAVGKYLVHLDEYIIEEQFNNCMMKTALKCPDIKPLAGYFIESLKNRLKDLSFRIKPGKETVVKDYDVFNKLESGIKNIFDHNKIMLLNKNRQAVYFYKSDLDVLNTEEKNLLALISQIPCTHEIIAKRMGISKSKVDMMIGSLSRDRSKWRGQKRIEKKLFPAYIRNRSQQKPWWSTTMLDAMDGETSMETNGTPIGDILADQGMGIEKAHKAGSDSDKDFDTSINIQDRNIKQRFNQDEKKVKNKG